LSNTAVAQDQKAKLPSKNELTSDEFNQWTAFINSLVVKQQFSGVVLLANNGEVKFQKAYGLARRNPSAPNRLNTKFSIASMGKMFTAVAILQLVEKGKLSLEDTVQKVAPGLMRKETAEKVKIKHLLNHTSGIENLITYPVDNWHHYLAVLEVSSLTHEPASKYDYNDWNYVALGAIVERVSGKDYFKYVQEHIFTPLKMTSTGNHKRNPPLNGAIGYYSVEENGKLRFGTRLYPGVLGSPVGGQYSTVHDLNVFLHALVTNKLLSPEMTRQMLTPKPELKNTRYGYGIQYFLDGKLVGHSGGDNVYPMDAWALLYPPTQYSLIVLSNLRTNLGDESTAKPIVTKLLDLIEK
jgi:CubicO group peptidase (beta-lactamase class C family)